ACRSGDRDRDRDRDRIRLLGAGTLLGRVSHAVRGIPFRVASPPASPLRRDPRVRPRGASFRFCIAAAEPPSLVFLVRKGGVPAALRTVSSLAQLKRRPMIGCGTSTFTDPDDYRANVPGGSVSLVLTGRGDFKARMTWVSMRRLRLLRV